MGDGVVKELRVETSNRARDMIESFMIAANGVVARYLTAHGWASIRRVVRAPKRWPRIVEIAATHGTTLPDAPDAPALEQFLRARRKADPEAFADLSLSVLKLLGRGEYIADGPGGPERGSARTLRSRSPTTRTRPRQTGGFRISSRSVW